MVNTVNQPKLKLGGAVVPLGWAVVPLLERPGVPVLAGRSIRLWGSGCTTSGAGCTAGVGKNSQIWIGDELGAEMDDLGGKFDRFRGWKVGKLGEMLEPLETKQIHGSKSTKHHQTNKSQKNLGAIFGGGFRI